MHYDEKSNAFLRFTCPVYSRHIRYAIEIKCTEELYFSLCFYFRMSNIIVKSVEFLEILSQILSDPWKEILSLFEQKIQRAAV